MKRPGNPLAPGYSNACIVMNAEQMMRDGYPRNQAFAAAYNEARKWFRRAHGQHMLPAHLRAPARSRNPVPPSSALHGQQARVNAASRLYEDFTGHEAQEIQVLDKPEIPDVLLVIGNVTGLMYETVRDGELEDFIHEFSSKARPTFAVSHDGTSLHMLGGAYNFTARGIVDKR